MVARVTYYAGDADQLVESYEANNAALRRRPGFIRGDLLVNRDDRRSLSITLWDSDQAEDASAGPAKLARRKALANVDVVIEAIETYKLALSVDPAPEL